MLEPTPHLAKSKLHTRGHVPVEEILTALSSPPNHVADASHISGNTAASAPAHPAPSPFHDGEWAWLEDPSVHVAFCCEEDLLAVARGSMLLICHIQDGYGRQRIPLLIAIFLFSNTGPELRADTPTAEL